VVAAATVAAAVTDPLLSSSRTGQAESLTEPAQ
jgi:hypothetical protein